jgi:HTH-type transcriptional regulator, cell division transcriptional repressor
MTSTTASATQYAQRVGGRLRRAREAAGLTLRELAAQVGLRDHTVILKYERGVTAPTITRLYALAQALRVTPAALLAAHDEAVALIAAVDTADQERREQLAFFFAALDESPPPAPSADTAGR